MTKVCVAGVTGWTGRPIAEAVLAADDLELVSGVARSSAGQDVGTAWGTDEVGVSVFGQVSEALEGVDVLVDYTSHSAVKANVMTAVENGVAAVVGSSGLNASDYAEIDEAARRRGVGVVAAGNFSITAAMAQAAATLVVRHLPQWEVIDYASAGKRDAPSGTARELAERLAAVQEPLLAVPVSEGREARGMTVGGAQVHSVRLPSFVVSTEVLFGLPDERLSIRHDAGGSPQPYISGTLLAVRAVGDLVGVVRGLDTLLLGDG